VSDGGPSQVTPNDLPNDFVERCKAVTAKRPRTVIEHILAHGFITTEERKSLKDMYSAFHPRRSQTSETRDPASRSTP
jgi:hypothetical protein